MSTDFEFLLSLDQKDEKTVEKLFTNETETIPIVIPEEDGEDSWIIAPKLKKIKRCSEESIQEPLDFDKESEENRADSSSSTALSNSFPGVTISKPKFEEQTSIDEKIEKIGLSDSTDPTIESGDSNPSTDAHLSSNDGGHDLELHRAEQLFLRKFAADISQDDYEFIQGTPQSIYNILPTSSVIPRPTCQLIAHLEGPDEWESQENFLNHACGRSLSTYPLLSGNKKEGSPICDTFQYRLYNNRAIFAVSDGCNWGIRPKLASRTANSTFVQYMEDHQGEIHTVREAGHLLLRATSHAHTEIKKQAKSLRQESGSTTLFGGILLELSERVTFDEFEEDMNWVFVCVNIGDCKAFCVRHSTREVEEISVCNRAISTDASDPGGRLGGNGIPDLRNLELFCYPCKEGDIILVCSDGVFDNLDPKPQGITPRELGINYDSWSDKTLDPRIVDDLFTKFRIEFLSTLLFENEPDARFISTQRIVQKLLYNSMETTRSSRRFMQLNPAERLPSDYSLFPGKMDHTTCLAATVGNVTKVSSENNIDSLSVTKFWGNNKESSFFEESKTVDLICPVLLNIPITVNAFQNDKEILLVCEVPSQCSVSCVVDESNVFLRVISSEDINYKKLLGDICLYGINELEQPMERIVSLPCQVEPHSKVFVYDSHTGALTITLQKKISKGASVNWIPIL